LRKIKLFLSLDNDFKWMFFETMILLGWGRLLKLVPFSKIAPKLGEQMTETPYDNLNGSQKVVRQISQMIQIVSKYVFWESECLVKALAARSMLKRRGLESTLYLGTWIDENGKLVAHAWLRSGPFYITGAEQIERFTTVACFANFCVPIRSKTDEI
jgi:hypothetical protein